MRQVNFKADDWKFKGQITEDGKLKVLLKGDLSLKDIELIIESFRIAHRMAIGSTVLNPMPKKQEVR